MTRRAPGYDNRSVYVNDEWSNGPQSRRYEQEQRPGYWVRQPDGSRVFYDRERSYNPPPAPFYFPGRPPGW
mgnify:FL=1